MNPPDVFVWLAIAAIIGIVLVELTDKGPRWPEL